MRVDIKIDKSVDRFLLVRRSRPLVQMSAAAVVLTLYISTSLSNVPAVLSQYLNGMRGL